MSASARGFTQVKNNINEIDLKEYEVNYKKAKKAVEKNSTNDYYVCYY